MTDERLHGEGVLVWVERPGEPHTFDLVDEYTREIWTDEIEDSCFDGDLAEMVG